jgi:short-subunit dehydrogenase
MILSAALLALNRISNLGIYEPKQFVDITDEDWLRFFQVNVMSGVRLARYYLPGMLERNWGRIIFISSESAIQTPPEMIHYGMTKSAQLAISRGLAEISKGTRVTVNTVMPGPTRSEAAHRFSAICRPIRRQRTRRSSENSS